MTGLKPKYKLTITLEPPDAGQVNGAGDYVEGKTVRVDATAFSGWKFMGWTVFDEFYAKPNLEITIDKDIAIIANFKKTPKFSPIIISLSIASFLLLVINIVNIYIITEFEKTIDSLNSKLHVIDGDKKELTQEVQRLESIKKNQETEMTGLKTEVKNLNTEINALKYNVRILKETSISYTLYEGELTRSTQEQIHKIYINSPKIVEAYLYDMTDDADLEILHENKTSIARASANGSVPDIINARITSSGWYTFRIYRNPTKYKLKVYIRN